jgi:hypothetical protein
MNQKCMKTEIKVKNIVGFLAIILSIFIIFRVITPLLLGVAYLLLALSNLFPLLSLEYKFIGGCFFLVIFWYILISIINATYTILKWGINNLQDKK